MLLFLAQVCVWVVSCLLFANSLQGEFVFDDSAAVLKNRNVDFTKPLHTLLEDDYWGNPLAEPSSHKSFRPITTFSFRINALCAGTAWKDGAPSTLFGFHAVNVGLHAANSALFLHLARLLFRRLRPALLSALLFAAHPIHSEPVANVTGRAELLSGFFFLSSLLSYISSSSSSSSFLRAVSLLLSLLLAGAAMLSKEQGYTVFGLHLAWELRCLLLQHKENNSENEEEDEKERGKEKEKESASDTVRKKPVSERPPMYRGSVSRMVLVAIVGAAVLGWRVWLNAGPPKFIPQENPASFHPAFQTRLLTYMHLASRNVEQLLLPLHLCHDYSHASIPLLHSLYDPRNLHTAAGFLTVAVVTARAFAPVFKNRWTVEDDVCAIGWSLLVLPFLPCSNLLFPVGFVLADRVLYLPSLGFSLHFALLLTGRAQEEGREGERDTEQRRKEGREEGGRERVILKEIDFNPAGEEGEEGEEESESERQERKERIELRERDRVTKPAGERKQGGRAQLVRLTVAFGYLFLLGLRTWTRNDDWRSGVALWQSGLAQYPQNPKHYYGLGYAYTSGTNAEAWDRGLELLKKATELRPDYVEAYYNLGTTLHRMAEHEKDGAEAASKMQLAAEALQMTVAFAPQHSEAQFNLGTTQLKRGLLPEATRALRAALAQAPQLTDAYFNLGGSLWREGSFEAAAHAYAQAISLEPTKIEAYYALGLSLGGQGLNREAEGFFKATVRMAGGHADAYFNLAVSTAMQGGFARARRYFLTTLNLRPDRADAEQYAAVCARLEREEAEKRRP